MTDVNKIIKQYNILDNGVDCKGIEYWRVSKPARLKDLTGEKYNQLTPIFPVKRKLNNMTHWLCLCDCGKLKVVLPANLVRNKTKSCGCLQSKVSRNHIIKINHSRRLNLKNKKFGELIVLNEEPILRKESPGVRYYWKCFCKKCGSITKIRSDVLTSGQKIYCELCNKHYSQGERKIYDLLIENNIFFETQKIFDSCRFKDTNFPAKFDFYVENKYLIEFDGRQHFKDYGNPYFNIPKIQEHDKIKNEWCLQNNIPLIRIPYTQISKLILEDLLLETTNFLVRRK